MELGKSPFAAALKVIGIPAAAQVMNAVVLTAVLSCLNSGLYVASRMNFALARRGDAPQWMVRLNGLLTCVSQLVLRRRLEREDPERLEVRMWLYPYLTYFTIAAIVVVIASMACSSATSARSSGSGS